MSREWPADGPDRRGLLRFRRREVSLAARRKGRRMSLGPSSRRNEPLYVVPMALALVFAAFLGAALGLVWQSAGFGGGEKVAAPATKG